MDPERLEKHWPAVRKRLKEVYVDLNDEDLEYERGRESELIGRLEKKTRKSRSSLEQELDHMVMDIHGTGLP